MPILVLVIAVQGTILISQSIASLLLDPAAVGRIRVFESIVSIGVLLAGFGAPALCIRELAAREHADRRGEVLRDLLILPVLGAMVICVVSLLATLFGAAWIMPLRDALFASSLLLLAINLVRMASALAQGLIIVRHVYLWVICGAIIAAGLQLAGAMSGSLPSWIAGRLLGELALLTLMLVPMRPHFPTVLWLSAVRVQSFFSTIAKGLTVNFGLIMRMTADAAPILILSGVIPLLSSPASDEDVGQFGIATLFLTAALLPPAVLSQRALPLISAAAGADRKVVSMAFRRNMLIVAIAVAASGAALANLLRLFDNGRMEPALIAASLLMISIPFKALATSYGTTMLARVELRKPIWATFIEVVFIAMIMKFGSASHLVATAVCAVVGGAMISLGGMYLFNRKFARAE